MTVGDCDLNVGFQVHRGDRFLMLHNISYILRHFLDVLLLLFWFFV